MNQFWDQILSTNYLFPRNISKEDISLEHLTNSLRGEIKFKRTKSAGRDQ